MQTGAAGPQDALNGTHHRQYADNPCSASCEPAVHLFLDSLILAHLDAVCTLCDLLAEPVASQGQAQAQAQHGQHAVSTVLGVMAVSGPAYPLIDIATHFVTVVSPSPGPAQHTQHAVYSIMVVCLFPSLARL